MRKITSPAELMELQRQLAAARGRAKIRVTVCAGTGCRAAKSDGLIAAFTKELQQSGLDRTIQLRQTGCYGFCERGPVVEIQPGNLCYLGVKDTDVPEIVAETLQKKNPVTRLLYEDDQGRRIPSLEKIPFYESQTRVLLQSNTQVNPRSIEDYFAIGGYSALAKALFTMEPKAIVDAISEAGLRGRGGGGFPTGTKWASVRGTPGEVKYVIVNADEGDPGAYMDRSLLEGNPHSIIEGLIIGAFAVGAHQGYVYVRQEYPLAVENTQNALERARRYGLLGKSILGSGFDFDVTIHRGAGAFVSGESTALMTAIEGRVGQPRPKYVHSSVSGLWGRPTALNNVETWANVPLIINLGPEWYKRMGTPTSRGTKVFSLVGKVKNTGLVEVPMGITLRDIVFKIGGGIPNGRKFKAVQTGGPSGGFLPESMLDLKVDFDELTRAGSMMGSGGMIVMDEDSCMVDAARYYVDFLAHESCGQCVPCREGLRQMRRILNRMVAGQGKEGDIETLEELCDLLRVASLCALGSSAPNPVMSALKHFRSEFEAHIRQKRCPSLVCQDLIRFQISPNKCKGCLLCQRDCPTSAISGKPKTAHQIEQGKCIKCGSCLKICPTKFGAISKVSGESAARMG